MLRIARTNFSEGYKALVHLKVVELFVESVLIYGLPANFTGVIIKVRCVSVRFVVFRLSVDAYHNPASLTPKQASVQCRC
jgi:hypothetical protein